MDYDAAKLRYGQAVAVEVDGCSPLLFRPLTRSEARQVSAQISANPHLEGDLVEQACANCCLSSDEDYGDFVDRYPLAVHDVLAQLMEVTRENVKKSVQTSARLLKQGDRNLGQTAENLLAFKAYAGGDYTDRQFAGALAVAELIATTKALTKMFEGLMKALARRSS